MLPDYLKKNIQSQHKTVRRAVTTSVCGRKSSSELFPLATTHAKVANSDNSEVRLLATACVIFSKKSGATAVAPGKLVRYSSSLLPTSVYGYMLFNGKMWLLHEYDAKEISFACIFLWIMCFVQLLLLLFLRLRCLKCICTLWHCLVLTSFRAPRLDNFRVFSVCWLRAHVTSVLLSHCYIVS